VNEAGFWTKIRGSINAHPHGVAHKLTDMFTAGTPDALYCIEGHTGVLELKYEPAWPKRSSTEVTVGLTENQRAWMLDWATKGWGTAWVLLGVAQEWFLLQIDEVPDYPVPKIPRAYLEEVAARGYGGTFKDLKTVLPALLAGVAPQQKTS